MALSHEQVHDLFDILRTIDYAVGEVQKWQMRVGDGGKSLKEASEAILEITKNVRGLARLDMEHD